MKHKINGDENHVINIKTRAIINDNDDAYMQAKIRRQQIVDKERELNGIKDTLTSLQNDMEIIKNLLLKNNG